MGKKSTPAPPPAPDPRVIAQTDAEFNRINQVTPYGSLNFSGPNRNTATLSLTPELQGLLDSQLDSDQNLLSMALERQGLLNSQPIDLSQFGDIQSQFGDSSGINFQGFNPTGLPQLDPVQLQQFQGGSPQLQQSIDGTDIQSQLQLGDLPGIPSDIQQYRGDVEQAFFDRQRALLDPVLADQQRSLESNLANRGLPRSGEAVDRDTTRFLDARNRAFTDLSRNAVLAGGSEASRQLGNILSARGQGFNEALGAGGFANQAAGQQFGQNLAQGGFANNAAQQGFQNDLSRLGFNNQAGLLGLGANSGIRSQLFGEQAQGNQLNNAASAQNVALQQQLLNNQNAARAQSLAEQQGVRGNQFNELAALLGLQQVQQPGLSSFYAPGQADVGGAFALNQQAQQNAYNANLANQGNALSGLFGLGGAILGGPVGGALGSGISGLFGSPSQPSLGGYFG